MQRNTRGGLIKYKNLLGQLVSRDLKLKYRRSVLGYLWSVLDPLFTMLVMNLVFSNLFKRDIEHFPVYLMSGQIMFSFMKQATSQAMNSVIGNGALLKKTYVPRYIFTLSTVTSSLVNLLFTLVALFIVMLATGVKVTWYMLLIPIPLLELYFFSLGLGLFLAQATVFLRDIKYIWDVFSLAWMYLTPIFYPIDALPKNLAELIKLFNPMYAYIGGFRDLILCQSISGYKIIIAGIGWAIISMAIGAVTFQKNEKDFILYI